MALRHPHGRFPSSGIGAGNVIFIKFKDQVKPWLSDAGYTLEQDLVAILKSLFGENEWVADPSLERRAPHRTGQDEFHYPTKIGYGQGVLRRRRRFKIVPLKPLAAVDNPQLAGVGDADPTPAFEIVEIDP